MSAVTWLAGLPRAGLNRLRIMLACHVLDGPVPSSEGFIDTMPDFAALLARGRLVPVDAPAPLIVKTNLLPGSEVLRPYAELTGKVVYLVRNPQDVIVSAARHLRVDPALRERFALDFIEHRGLSLWAEHGCGSWPCHVREWTEPQRLHRSFPAAEVLVVRYEDLHADPARTLERVLRFVGPEGVIDPEHDGPRVQRALRNSSPEVVRATLAAEHSRGVYALTRPRHANQGPDTPKPPRGPVADRGPMRGEVRGHVQRPAAAVSGPAAGHVAGGSAGGPLGGEVRDAYQRMLKDDEEFAELLRRFGYES
jgi:hypothetical protein